MPTYADIISTIINIITITTTIIVNPTQIIITITIINTMISSCLAFTLGSASLNYMFCFVD